jgi:threonine dehydrogenase-like Zn-dependent dehydrogenase
MAQPLSSPYPISEHAEAAGKAYSKAYSVSLVAGAGLVGLALTATLGLWFHYGTQVFFETIRAGLSACF